MFNLLGNAIKTLKWHFNLLVGKKLLLLFSRQQSEQDSLKLTALSLTGRSQVWNSPRSPFDTYIKHTKCCIPFELKMLLLI